MSAIANPEAPLDTGGEERELCRTCLTPNAPGATFCRDCGAPLSGYAATGPFESLLAEGHVYRSAVERPQKLIVLLGMWVIFGSAALVGLALLVLARHDLSPLAFTIGGMIVVGAVIILWRTTRNFMRARSVVGPADSASKNAG
jgi:hypothetical protein